MKTTPFTLTVTMPLSRGDLLEIDGQLVRVHRRLNATSYDMAICGRWWLRWHQVKRMTRRARWHIQEMWERNEE